MQINANFVLNPPFGGTGRTALWTSRSAVQRHRKAWVAPTWANGCLNTHSIRSRKQPKASGRCARACKNKKNQSLLEHDIIYPIRSRKQTCAAEPVQRACNADRTCNTEQTRRLVCSYCLSIRPPLVRFQGLTHCGFAISASFAPSVQIVLAVMPPLVANRGK